MNFMAQEGPNFSRELNLGADKTCFKVTVKIEPPARSEAVAFLLEKKPASYAELYSLPLELIVQALQELIRYRDSLGRKMAEIDSSIHFLKNDGEESNEEKIVFLKSVKKRMDQARKEVEGVIKIYRYGESEVRSRNKQKMFGIILD